MSTEISLEEKEAFILWVLVNCDFENRDPVRVLGFLLDSYSDILENVCFVDDLDDVKDWTARTIEISTSEMGGVPFSFCSGLIMTSDSDEAIYSMGSNSKKKVYIQINFPDKYDSREYLDVLGDKVSVISKKTDELIEEILSNSSRQILLDEIDEALDSGDEEKFMELSKRLAADKERTK